MANWNRVWQSDNCGGSCGDASSCPTSCYNYVGNQLDPCKSILNSFPSCIQTIGDAMMMFAYSLARRLGASDPIVKSASDSSSTLTLRLNRRADSVATITMTMALGYFPITCSLVYGAKSGSGVFSSLDSLENWLIKELK